MEIRLIGEYESTLDSKGRFLLPAAFKKKLPEDSGNIFVINRGFEKCLTLYPMKSWTPVFERISALDDFDGKIRSFRRHFLNGAIEIEMDGAGRLNIPNSLISYAGFKKDLILASAINKLEIWDAETYNKLFENFSSTEYSDLAAQVMRGPTVPANPLAGLI